MRLRNIFCWLQDAVVPARDGEALPLHQLLAGKAGGEPIVVDPPHASPVLPSTGGQAVVAGQGIGVGADVSGALDVVVAPEDVGAAAWLADVAEGELNNAGRPHLVATDARLGETHAPDQRAGPQLGDHPGNFFHLIGWDAGYALGFLGRPRLDLLADLFEAPHALGDVVLVLPPVGQDLVQNAPQEGDVGA